MAKDPMMGPITEYGPDGAPIIKGEDATEQAVADAGGVRPRGMRTIIWAGGRGTRLEEETRGLIPKPLVNIGEIPMIEHIVKIYAAQGLKDFVIAAGYKGDMLKDWLYDSRDRLFESHEVAVAVVETGEDTQTGGRLLRLGNWLYPESGDRAFLATYGDGLADVNVRGLVAYHRQMVNEYGVLVTLTAVRPPARFGDLRLESGLVREFGEKQQLKEGWINGGFYVIEAKALELVNGDMCKWEYDVLPQLALQGKLAAFQHPGYFQMCDTWRDLQLLNQVWEAGDAPWARFG